MKITNFEEIKSKGEVYKLKTGELVFLATDSSHYYFLNETYLPSVTAILGEAAPIGYGLKEFWKNNTKEESEAIFEAAGEFGTKMHDAYEQLLTGKELNLLEDYPTDKEKKSLVAFVDWFRYYAPSEFESEQPVASMKYSYAGTLDFVGTINGERWLIDFKTSTGIQMSHQLQVLAYKQAYEESFGQKIDRVGILRTGTSHKGNTIVKDGKLKEVGKGWEFREVTDYKIEDFMGVYNVYLMLHGGEIPQPNEIIVFPSTLQLLEKK